MRTVLAASLIAFFFASLSTASFATETGMPETESTAVPDGEPTPPQTKDEQPNENESTGSDAGDDVMKNFTRHRPGACPEGPPCKVED